MRALFDWTARLLDGLAAIAVLVSLVILTASVVLRYVFNFALSWSDELALLLFTWAVLLSVATALRRNMHARMELLTERLPAPAREVWEQLINVAILLLSGFIIVAGSNYMMETRGSTSAAIGYPVELLYASGPVFGIALFLFSLERILLRPKVRS